MPENPNRIRTPADTIAYLACAAALNLPFVLGHPAWPVVDLPLLRSLVVGLVLFLVPGLPWVGVMIGRGWPARFRVLLAMAASLAVLLGVLAVFRLAALPVTGRGVWNAVWILTNAAVLLNAVAGGPPAWGIRLREPCWRTGGPLFVLAYALFFYGATRVVPPQEDQDLDIIPGGYALLTRFEPLFVGDYFTVYQFAHPPLFHWWVGGSFLYFDRLEYLKYYDQAAQRARMAVEGRPPGQRFEPFRGEVEELYKGTGRHRFAGLDGSCYLIDPPLSDGTNRITACEFEHAVIAAYYRRDPCFPESRTPTVFLSALTVALLGCWIGSIARTWWPATLLPLAYATSPEVFARSGFTGYTAVSNFAVLMLLMAVDEHQSDRRRGIWGICFLAGGLAGLINHKLILLPAAIILWRIFAPASDRPLRRLAAGVSHPAVIGFLAAAVAFWLFGLSVNPAAFWKDHVQTHLVDRLLHHNPLGYGGYPSVPGLWIELWQHTGYLLLPMAVMALGLGCARRGNHARTQQSPSLQGSFRLWAIWTLITAVAFSVVDWRQTKHLMPLMLVFHLAPIRWASGDRRRLALVAVVFLALLAWNLWTLRTLVIDFEGFSVTPGW